AEFRQQVLEHHHQQRFVFDDEDSACHGVSRVVSWGSRVRMWQCTPSGGKARVTSPPRSCPRPRSSRRRPNPLCVGGSTGGPPCSCHSSRSSPPASPWRVQRMRTPPPGTDSEPYFTALVHSSWSAI